MPVKSDFAGKKYYTGNMNEMEKPEINEERMKGVYTALFVADIESLKAQFPPKHSGVFLHHSTIEFQPFNLDDVNIGEHTTIKILGRAHDDKGDALLVENSRSKNKYPHITVSCADGVPPVYSNELLEKAITDGSIEIFDSPYEIEVIEGYSSGGKDFISEDSK
ncbi:MAG: hypothetical protein WCP91_02090 [Candidatus Berkelbacteria bacterium]